MRELSKLLKKFSRNRSDSRGRLSDDRGRSHTPFPTMLEQAHRSLDCRCLDIQSSTCRRPRCCTPIWCRGPEISMTPVCAPDEVPAMPKNAYLDRGAVRDAEHSYLNERHPGEVNEHRSADCAHGRSVKGRFTCPPARESVPTFRTPTCASRRTDQRRHSSRRSAPRTFF